MSDLFRNLRNLFVRILIVLGCIPVQQVYAPGNEPQFFEDLQTYFKPYEKIKEPRTCLGFKITDKTVIYKSDLRQALIKISEIKQPETSEAKQLETSETKQLETSETKQLEKISNYLDRFIQILFESFNLESTDPTEHFLLKPGIKTAWLNTRYNHVDPKDALNILVILCKNDFQSDLCDKIKALLGVGVAPKFSEAFEKFSKNTPLSSSDKYMAGLSLPFSEYSLLQFDTNNIFCQKIKPYLNLRDQLIKMQIPDEDDQENIFTSKEDRRCLRTFKTSIFGNSEFKKAKKQADAILISLVWAAHCEAKNLANNDEQESVNGLEQVKSIDRNSSSSSNFGYTESQEAFTCAENCKFAQEYKNKTAKVSLEPCDWRDGDKLTKTCYIIKYPIAIVVVSYLVYGLGKNILNIPIIKKIFKKEQKPKKTILKKIDERK